MNKRILILDDHQALLDVVTEALAYEEFEVLDISLGSQLFDAVRNFMPGLILAGLSFGRYQWRRPLPAIEGHTGILSYPGSYFFSLFTPADAANPSGCDGILYKPFDLDALLSTVYGHLEGTVGKANS